MTEIFALICGLFLLKRTLRYLRYFQQEGYEVGRFLRWIKEQKAWDKRASVICLLAWLIHFIIPNAALLFAAIPLAALAFFEGDPRSEGKVPLKMTARALRIYFTASFLTLTAEALIFLYFLWPLQILVFQIPPFALIVAGTLLRGDERRRCQALVAEATEVLKRVSPMVIGITGSYGKTSTKNALGNVLQIALGPTFWPEKGVNTEMGNVREIRTRLKPLTKYAVVEMGAYGKGSIERLCALTPPSAAIITCVGVAHLERFGSEENIYQAKSELARAVPQEGILVCNGDNRGARRMSEAYPKKTTLLYGFSENVHCRIVDFRQTLKGSEFVLEWQGISYQGETKLMGATAVSNLAAAFTMACALGAQPELAVAALSCLEPVDNRLHFRNEEGKLFLHDAYNSNPQGFMSALNTLASLPAKRRFLMTPGMIELGESSRELHEQVGRKAAGICDFAFIVGGLNRKTLTQGLLEGGMHKSAILHCENREEAFATIQARMEEGDALLIENDLADVHDLKESF